MAPPIAVLLMSLMFLGGEDVLNYDLSREIFPFLLLAATVLPFFSLVVLLIKLLDDEGKLAAAILLVLNTLVVIWVGYFAYLTAWV